MNTNIIAKSKTKSLPIFPELVIGKTNRRVTKHYTNTCLWLHPDYFSLLTWLMYQCYADNTFTYSTRLLNQYSKASYSAQKQYSGELKTVINLVYVRKIMKSLIEDGLILNTGTRNKMMINPMLTYEPDIIGRKQYAEVCKKYQSLVADDVIGFTNYFTNLVSRYLETKKKNYKYNQNK